MSQFHFEWHDCISYGLDMSSSCDNFTLSGMIAYLYGLDMSSSCDNFTLSGMIAYPYGLDMSSSCDNFTLSGMIHILTALICLHHVTVSL